MMGRQSTPGGVALRPCPAVPCSSSSLAHNPSAQLRPLQCMCTCTMPQSKWSARMRTPPDVHAGRAVAVAVVEGFLDLLCDTRQYALLATCVAYCTVYYTCIHAASRRVWSLDALHTSRRHCWATRTCVQRGQYCPVVVRASRIDQTDPHECDTATSLLIRSQTLSHVEQLLSLSHFLF